MALFNTFDTVPAWLYSTPLTRHGLALFNTSFDTAQHGSAAFMSTPSTWHGLALFNTFDMA
jgi:hypothetical protein